MGRVVGIDLGTTNSVVAVMEGGKPVVIANAEGMRTTPSVVSFTKDGDRLAGQMARRQAVLDPKNTFFNVKRFIGRQYGELSPDSKRVPYTIRRNEEGNVRLVCPRLDREFAPEELSAIVLRKLVDEATRYLGQPVTGAVITVPAYFNDSQRQATRDAGRIAGIDIKRILNEPTAAALAYGLDRRESQMVLVFDLGGGTFDVSILEVGDGVFQVRATSGDTQLGGNDFDRKIVDWLAEQFVAEEGIDLRRDRQALQRLNEGAEKAKIELSGIGVTDINLPFIIATEDGPKHVEARLSRGEFESMCGDLVERLKLPVRQALSDAGLLPRQIDEIVLVGGSTRMPMVQELVQSIIYKEPNQNVNPDEVVAIGAAIQAGIIAGDVRDVMLLDVTPLSLGLETIGGVMKPLIPRNTSVPVRRSDIFSTSENSQTVVEVHVLQGERPMAADNKSLGRFKLMGIPPAPRGIPQVQVSFDIDSNGILQVSALDKTTGREQTVTIQGASTLSETEINRMLQESEDYAQADRQKKAKVDRRNKAESLASQCDRKLREVQLDYGMYFAEKQRREVEALIREVRDCLKADDERGLDLAVSDLQDALDNLKREITLRTKEDDDDEDFFKPLKETFEAVRDSIVGNDEDDRYRYDGGRDSGRFGPGSDAYGRDAYSRDVYNRDAYSRDIAKPSRDPRDGDRSRSRFRSGSDDWDDDDDWF
jgi:molecular chaperone DnaK